MQQQERPRVDLTILTDQNIEFHRGEVIAQICLVEDHNGLSCPDSRESVNGCHPSGRSHAASPKILLSLIVCTTIPSIARPCLCQRSFACASKQSNSVPDVTNSNSWVAWIEPK